MLFICSPQLEEKIKLEQGKIKDLTRMQRETLDDVGAVSTDLEDLQEKCRHIHMVAEAEKRRTEERKEELASIVAEAR